MNLAPVIPTQVHGFAVTVTVGPYPPDQPGSHRSAVYAELVPVADDKRKAMRRAGKHSIRAISPLTVTAAQAIRAEPNGRLAEVVATQTLRQAEQLARLV